MTRSGTNRRLTLSCGFAGRCGARMTSATSSRFPGMTAGSKPRRSRLRWRRGATSRTTGYRVPPDPGRPVAFASGVGAWQHLRSPAWVGSSPAVAAADPAGHAVAVVGAVDVVPARVTAEGACAHDVMAVALALVASAPADAF